MNPKNYVLYFHRNGVGYRGDKLHLVTFDGRTLCGVWISEKDATWSKSRPVTELTLKNFQVGSENYCVKCGRSLNKLIMREHREVLHVNSNISNK